MKVLNPESQKRLKALNDIFGIEPEQIQEGLSPLDIGMIAPRTYDAFVSAPIRSGIGQAITGGNMADIGKSVINQVGKDPDLAPSFGIVEDILSDPLAAYSLLEGATKAVPNIYSRLKALGELGAVGDVSKSPGFFSNLIKTVEEKMGNSATPEQVKGMLRDIKPEEMEWLGAEKYIQENPKINKEDFIKHLQSNVPEIRRSVKQSYKVDKSSKYLIPSVEEILNKSNTPDDFELMLKNDYKAYKDLMGRFPELEKSNDFAEDVTLSIYKGLLDKNVKPPKYQQYTLPGGENYREIVFQMPGSKKDTSKRLDELYKIADQRNLTEAESDEMVALERAVAGQSSFADNDVFRTQHFNDPNVLAHARVKDRLDPQGKKILFAEEIQSDWHQAGRKQGYKQNIKIPKPTDLVAIRDPDFKRAGYRIETKDGQFVTNVFGDPVKRKTGESYGVPEWTPETAIKEAISRITESPDSIYPQSQFSNKNKVPNAPLKKTWHEYVMKNLVKDAVEGGYDKVAWTTGKQQADRFNLSKHVDEIAYNPKKQELIAYPKNTSSYSEGIRINVKPNDLADYIGEEKSKQLLATTPRTYGIEPSENKFHVLSNQDLEIGGEGMKGFYDKILVDYAKKFGKKYGAKVGQIDIATPPQGTSKDAKLLADLGLEGTAKMKEPVHFLEITPKMREEILKKGLPLFAAPAALRIKALED
jgi:uncharacterized protein YneF (UPF0154 family)